MSTESYATASRIISGYTHGRVAIEAVISSKVKFSLYPNVHWQLEAAFEQKPAGQETIKLRVDVTRGSFISRESVMFAEDLRLWELPQPSLEKLDVSLADAYAYAVRVNTPLTKVLDTLFAASLAETSKLYLAFRGSRHNRDRGRIILTFACGKSRRLSGLDVRLGPPEKDGRRKIICGKTFPTDIGHVLP